MRLLTALATAGLIVAGSAVAATPRVVGTFQDWNVYTVEDSNGRLCYAASVPRKEDGNWTRRGARALIVAKLPGAPPNEQVSVQPGYTFKKDTSAQVTVDGQRYAFFTRGEHGWANSPAEDATIIEAMKRGTELTVRGTSTRDTWSLDTYSLLGFTAAYNAMRNACATG
jgi:hypothetical protein